MNKFILIIAGTPWWVWVALGYILFVGVKSVNTHKVFLPKLFIIPAILIGLKYDIITSGADLILIWLGCLSLGGLTGFWLVRNVKIKIDKKAKTVELPGNYSTLLILLSFFAVKYVFGYLEATESELALTYTIAETAISAAFSGYFLGKALFYLNRLIE